METPTYAELQQAPEPLTLRVYAACPSCERVYRVAQGNMAPRCACTATTPPRACRLFAHLER